MFNDDDIANELYRSMEKQLVSNQLENKYAFNKFAKTLDYLKQAADIFDQAGMHQEANEVTQVISSFAKKLHNQKIALADDKKKLANAIYDSLWAALNHVKNVYNLAIEDGVSGASGVDGNPDHAFSDILAAASSNDNVNALKEYSNFEREVGWVLAECNTFTNVGYSITHTIIKDKNKLEQAKTSYSKALYNLREANRLLELLKK